MNIFKEMGLAIYSVKSYKNFLNNRKSKVFGFGVLLMLLYFTVTMIIPFIKFAAVDGGIAALVDEVPYFEFENGYLSMEEVIEYDIGTTYICIDTEPGYYFYGADEIGEVIYDYTEVLLMDSEKMVVKNQGQIQELYYADFVQNFTKDDLEALVPAAYTIIAVFMILAYVWMTALFFFGVLFVALAGMIAASCFKYNLTFGQLYLLGIYTRTLPLIIKAVLSLLPVDIGLNILINFGISVIIIICAVSRMKKDDSSSQLETADMNGANEKNDFSWMQ